MTTDNSQPYTYSFQEESDGRYSAWVEEFPGCNAEGDTIQEALDSLKDAAASWMAAVKAQGMSVPEPFGAVKHSGRLVLRVPRSLHARASKWAAREGVSLNQFISGALSERVGEMSQASKVEQRVNVKLSELARRGTQSGRALVVLNLDSLSSSTVDQGVSAFPLGQWSGTREVAPNKGRH
jgi:predicted RNase H-like HicB family nuclease